MLISLFMFFGENARQHSKLFFKRFYCKYSGNLTLTCFYMTDYMVYNTIFKNFVS